MDFLDISGIQRALNSSSSTESLASPSSIIPPDVFVTFAALFASATISKSYFDTVNVAVQTSPHAVVAVYSIGAWVLSGIMGYLTSLMGQGQLDVTGVGSVHVFIQVPNIQLIRWSLILGYSYKSTKRLLICK
jgi:hypothetical protein